MKNLVPFAALLALAPFARAETPVGGTLLVPRSGMTCSTVYRGGGACPYCDPDYGYGYRTRPSRPFSTLAVPEGIEGITSFTSEGTCREIQIVDAAESVVLRVEQRNVVRDELGVTTSLILKSGNSLWTGRKHESTR